MNGDRAEAIMQAEKSLSEDMRVLAKLLKEMDAYRLGIVTGAILSYQHDDKSSPKQN